LEQKCLSLAQVIFNNTHIQYNIYISIGPIGLVSMLAAKAMGADTIIMTGKAFA
jgi:hypothetical protein